MNFWKRNISLSQDQEKRKASKIATWLDRLTNDKNCHFDPFGKNNPTFDKLAERIASQAGITPSHNNTDCRNNHFMPDLPPRLLAWNKNPQCPPKIWDNLQAPTDGKYDLCNSTGYKCCIWRSENNKEQERFNNLIDCGWNSKCSSKPGWEYSKHKKCLVTAHHNSYSDTLKTADYAGAYFNSVFNKPSTVCHSIINADSGEQHGFYLINEDDTPFVYAILKSSMFRAWCELTANSKGNSHFTTGMWGTFPIQDIRNPLSQLKNLSPEIETLFPENPTVGEAIKQAGQWLKNRWTQSVSFDECMDELCGFGHLPSDYSTLSRLSISRTSMPLSGSVVTDFLNKDIAKVIELAEKNVSDDFEELIDKLYGFGNLSNIKLSELPKPLSDDVEDLFKSERDIDVKKAIKLAGEWQKNGWKNNRRTFDFKKCMTELCSLSLVTYSLRIQILAEGFLDAFYGV